MSAPPAHRGIAEDDPRNRGVIDFFRPKEVTPDSARETIARAAPRLSAAEVQRHVDELMRRIAEKPHKPPPPLSQALEAVDDPLYGLSTHPDLVTRLWKLDETLPQRCRWVCWGYPALVHPQTGVVFAVAYGTIGTVMRLPPDVLARASAEEAPVTIAGNPGQTFDIAPAGPEWRFLRRRTPETDWCRAAYDFAAAAD